MEIEDALYMAVNLAYNRLILLGDYEGRHTLQGQQELILMRDALARYTGEEPKDVQDEAEARRARSLLDAGRHCAPIVTRRA